MSLINLLDVMGLLFSVLGLTALLFWLMSWFTEVGHTKTKISKVLGLIALWLSALALVDAIFMIIIICML